ncbi:putative membrane protein [Anoxybacillus sp. B7M1]|jgi:hypothetical protein|uniref:hypothetical protein n=1 Tax=unclassified Anoxybacillus TaxID=2639704 RepID=UPI0005CD9394|nr:MULTISPECIES: hypothetical protein [unclassified Anoxybacillus]ANB58154.1 putative membrane protein [Anoxybacillus sp. B2M1]ANB64373.1 putative membrane protein [Anoxybacillus sp. B7M1]
MRQQLFYVAIGYVCGYLMISWMPDVTPFTWVNFLADFTFRPLHSFLAMACFFIGFLANAMAIRTMVEGAVQFFVRKIVNWYEWLASYTVVGSFYWLFHLNKRLSLLFFIFSVVYGMIAVDFSSGHRYKKLL